MSKKSDIIFDEDTFNKGEFYYDLATMNNPKHKIHSSLQIGNNGRKWSRMSSTTSPAKKRKYIELTSKNKDGKSIYVSKSIKTSSISSKRKKDNKTHLTETDKGRIKAFIYSIINKKRKANKNARAEHWINQCAQSAKSNR